MEKWSKDFGNIIKRQEKGKYQKMSEKVEYSKVHVLEGLTRNKPTKSLGLTRSRITLEEFQARSKETHAKTSIQELVPTPTPGIGNSSQTHGNLGFDSKQANSCQDSSQTHKNLGFDSKRG